MIRYVYNVHVIDYKTHVYMYIIDDKVKLVLCVHVHVIDDKVQLVYMYMYWVM